MRDRDARQIVIAGGGTAGWMAAATLARFLGQTAAITLVESDAIGTIGVGEATIPQIHLFNHGLGIDERQFVAATKASFKLGIEFQDWLRPGHRYMHAFGIVGRGSGITPFRQLWARARLAGRAGEYGQYSFNETAARGGKMAGPSGGGAIPDLTYAYHFDASLFAAFLRRYAEARGVVRIEGTIDCVDRDGESGDIAAIEVSGGRRVEGDLFIDCTGFRSMLLGEGLGTPFIDWSSHLPCDRALAVPCEPSEAFRPYTQSIARTAGWQWRIPLQHRTGNGHVYCSQFVSDDEAAATLLANLDGAALDEPRPLRFTTGHRESFWSHNCIALGLAAGFMEPLESTSIHLIQSGLARLLTLFPSNAGAAAARDQFNRLSTIEWERIRDFLMLHYVANQRIGEPFWDQCRAMPLPDSLRAKIDLFEEGGSIVRESDELFTEEAWSQVMIGQGVMPRTTSPLANQVPTDELGDYMDTIADAYRRKAGMLPSHADYLANMLGQPVGVAA